MKVEQVLKQQIKIIKPSSETIKEIKTTTRDFVAHLEKKLKAKKIKADVFVGGSLAKNTIVKKDKYDVDIFIRFDKKYGDKEISKLLGKVVGKAKKVHGSRDYYQERVGEAIMEIIPVMKIKRQQQAQNITDLSYFHVSYINKHVNKNKKLADEVILAKTFCHAQGCYGAESYIHGFSGYALELLICYYKSFNNFLKAVTSISYKSFQKRFKQNTKKEAMKNRRLSSKSNKISDNKIIIDIEKLYKNKEEILRDLNKSKSHGPMILIDPTFKERNALAGLSWETFEKFKQVASRFLKNPSDNFFKKKEIRGELEKKYKNKLLVLNIKTTKQPGDISGTKSKKFFEFFNRQLIREFQTQIAEFDYDEEKNIAYFFFIINKKKDEVIKGPPTSNKKHLAGFKKAHKNAFLKSGFACAKIKHDLSFNKWFELFKSKNKKIIKDMDVKSIGLGN